MTILRDSNVQHKLGDLLAKHMAASNLLGRAQVAQRVRLKTGKIIPIASSSRLHVRFEEGDDLTGGFSTDLPAGDAADHLRGLTPVTRLTFNGLSSQYQRDAFTVAGVSDVRLIEKVRDELAQVMKTGGTQKDFEAAVAKLTSEAGVAEIAAFTLDTVFATNMQKAYSLGRFEQLTDPAVRAALPYWQYLTVGDGRVRPEHAVLDYFCARAEDPVWRRIYPPNGFNCRCIVIGLLEEEAPEGSDDDGTLRLPLLAREKVPTPGFGKVFDVAA